MINTALVVYNTEMFGGERKNFLFPIPKEIQGFVYEEPQKVLEYIFRQCNHVNGVEWIAGQDLRSMSVGDTVQLGNTIWKCEAAGWSRVD